MNMAKRGFFIAVILGLLHVCSCQNCVDNCKTQHSDALASKTGQSPDCMGLTAYVGCVAACQDAAEIQAATQDLTNLCNTGGAQTAGGGMSVLQSAAMTACPALAVCFSSVDITSIDFTNIKQLCTALTPAITCMKKELDTCSGLSASQRSTVSQGLQQLDSLCQVETGHACLCGPVSHTHSPDGRAQIHVEVATYHMRDGGGVQLQVVKQWLAAVGASQEELTKIDSCQAVKSCAMKHTIDTSKLLEAVTDPNGIDMKVMCQLITPLYDCTAAGIKTCDVTSAVKQRFVGTAQMYSTFCRTVKAGGDTKNYNNFAQLMVAAQNQGSSGTSSLTSDACTKWMTCLSNGQTPVATDQELDCGQLKSMTACYESSAGSCDMAKQFKPIADEAKMNYKDKCSAGTQISPFFSAILALLAFLYAVCF